ncbi:uncharacterized protein LOC141574140 [Camelus bactrianus]|uniref:Uncharacterized protein LOC141574140 n=1 Tax=Camelus bactrianus TaxID=9837 RepID=A0AC58P1W9_CAMBA
MSRSGRRIAPLRVKAGRSCSGSRGRRRSGDWAAAYVRFVCHRRAGKLLLGFGEANAGPGALPTGPQVMACSREAFALLSRSAVGRGLRVRTPGFVTDSSRPGASSATPCSRGARLAVSRLGFAVRVRGRGGRWRRAAADGELRRRQRAASCGGGQRRLRSAAAGVELPAAALGGELRRRGEGVLLGASQLAPVYPVCSAGGLSCRRFPGLGVLGMETRPKGQRGVPSPPQRPARRSSVRPRLARQAPFGSARPHSPHPEQQEPQPEGPRLRREEGHARTRGCPVVDAGSPRCVGKLGAPAAAPEEEGVLGTGLPLMFAFSANAGQAPIGSARPHSPHPEQQEPQPEGPRFRPEEERRARTRGSAGADAGSAWSLGKLRSCSGSRGRRRSGDWALEDAVRSRGSISGGQGLSQDPALAQTTSSALSICQGTLILSCQRLLHQMRTAIHR